MKKKHILFFLFCIFLTGASAQSLERGKTLLAEKKYDEALKFFEQAVKRRVTSAQLYLGQTYDALYRFEDAVECYEDYIEGLAKRKKPTEEAEKHLEKSKANLRMLKGVEDVCIIDSFVVDKARFLEAYKISEESGKIFTYDDYFKTEGKHPGTVYETEIGNRIYYSELGQDSTMNIYSKNKLLNEWSKGSPLPGSINKSADANYPYVLTDGITIYYAGNGAEAMGGYDIFVTRYNTNNDTYLVPENVGMPFNSPSNDYMYVIDEYNNLGWFASDRHQPEGKVCIYVFIPNSSKQTYNYEAMDQGEIIRLAQLHSLKDTWKDKNPEEIKAARQRLQAVINHKPKVQKSVDFEFVIDDNATYNHLADFKSPRAKELYLKYEQLEKDFIGQKAKLANQRQWYAGATKAEQDKAAPAILDLEKRVEQMADELDNQAIQIRIEEKKHTK